MAQCNKCGKKGMFVKVNFEGYCDDCQKLEYTSMREALTPEHNECIDLEQKLLKLKNEVALQENNIQNQLATINKYNGLITELKEEVVQINEQIMFEEFGLYKPTYDFVNSDAYKNQLSLIRNYQKNMIKTNTAVMGNKNWVVNNSKAQGSKMVSDMQKLLLRAFNSECDEVIEKVKYNTFDSALKRISSSAQAISKLGKIMNIYISDRYYELKTEELKLALEYRQKEQEEKEQQQEMKRQQREELKVQKEIEAARKKIEKELNHYENALAKANRQLETAKDAEKEELLNKIKELEAQIAESEKSMKDIDYREANQKAGYVYIISNIGAFGENVYKIGMTRRLDPQERIDELGDASVPFKFDVHAMIFSDNAPALENTLHKAFENKKLNMVNQRREFFRVTIEEIKEVIKNNYDKTAEFIEIPDAEQFRISEKMRSEL